jgi:hypothetical protein
MNHRSGRGLRLVVVCFAVVFGALATGCRVRTAGPEVRPPAVAGRALVPPAVDGRCDETEYAAAGAVVLAGPAGPAGRARILHDGLDLFVCVDRLDPAAARRATVQIDPVLGEGAGPATLTFASGAEQRIDLARVGGFARSVGLRISVDEAHWPAQGKGELVLGPVYRDVAAGSVFVEGRRGFLAVPDAAALHPSGELTVEAWVRPADGACGTLVSSGADELSLSLCGTLRVRLAGTGDAAPAGPPLDTAWHHVAFTIDHDDIRRHYIDGELVFQQGHEQEQREHSSPPATPRRSGSPAVAADMGMLRIGSDPAVAANEDRFRGNLREVRIWSRARTVDEIRATAFSTLAGKEPGLIAVWPLTHDLRERVAGRDAGLVGTAAFAREALTMTAFPTRDRTPPPAYKYPPPQPVPAWAPQLVAQPGATVQLDGRCDDAAYVAADELRLEPDRQRTVAMLLADDALYVCARPVPGRAGGVDGLSFFIGAQRPLAIHLGADGVLKVARADGAAVPDLGIAGRAATAPALASGQEGIGTVQTAWWSGELRIPRQAIPGFQTGAPLVLAVRVAGSLALEKLPAAVRAGLDPRAEVRIAARWPAQLDPANPRSWGTVPTMAGGVPVAVLRAGAPASSALAANDLRLLARFGPWPQTGPGVTDFQTSCPTLKGTATIYVAGIEIKTIDLPDDLPYAFDRNLKWPMVDRDKHPMVTASGHLAGLELSTLDSPFIHTSHDLDMVLSTDDADAWLILDDARTSRELVLETENGGLPFYARPLPNEHVTVRGRWIFDCGHSPKTEVHPLPYFASDHKVVLPTGFGSTQDVQLVRVRLTAHPGAFSYALEPFTFNVDLPRNSTVSWPLSGGSERFVRVQTALGATVTWHAEPNSTQLTVTVTPASAGTDGFVELLAGYIDSPQSPAEVTGTQLVHGPDSTMFEKVFDTYTVTLEAIDITNDRKAELEKTAGIRGSGKWHLDAIINGRWHGLLINQAVNTGDSLGLGGVPPVATLPGRLTLDVTGFVNNDPFDGLHLGTAAMNIYDLGDLKSLCCDTTRTFSPPPDGKPWRVRYHVSVGGDVTPIYPDRPWWRLRLADNDRITTSLGALPLDPSGAPHVLTRDAYITEPPLQHDNVLLDPDVDGYHFSLDDFADVEIAPLASSLVLEQHPLYDYEGYTSMPPALQAIVGYGRNYLTVRSTTGNAGEVPYTIRITTRYKKLDPDWGVTSDRPEVGRAVDLRTPDPAAHVTRTTKGLEAPSETRSLTMPWSWQHVPGETHYYRVTFPTPTRRPSGHKSCEYDVPATLTAGGAFMSATLLGDPGPDRPLAERFPSGQVIVQVENTMPSIMGKRAVYRFGATFSDARWLTPAECDLVRHLVGTLHTVNTPFPIAGSMDDLLRYVLGETGPGVAPGGLPPGPGPVTLGPLGNGWAVHVGPSGRFETSIRGQRDGAVEPRLYDDAGVLIGVGTIDPRTGGAHIAVPGLEPGGTYVLQIVPAFDAPRDRASVVPLSFVRP